MKLVFGLALMLSFCPLIVNATTFEWNRNSEPEIKDYMVYVCFTAGCVVSKDITHLQPGSVLQSAVGVSPIYVLDITGKVGSLAVTARNTSLIESGLSVALPFQGVAPQVPQNLHVK